MTRRPDWQRWVLGYAWLLGTVGLAVLAWWFLSWLIERMWP